MKHTRLIQCTGCDLYPGRSVQTGEFINGVFSVRGGRDYLPKYFKTKLVPDDTEILFCCEECGNHFADLSAKYDETTCNRCYQRHNVVNRI